MNPVKKVKNIDADQQLALIFGGMYVTAAVASATAVVAGTAAVVYGAVKIVENVTDNKD
ncbi:membrane protein [Gordonia phage Pherobrine]|nr:membrane protein [Gordonia phage Pherobrine]